MPISVGRLDGGIFLGIYLVWQDSPLGRWGGLYHQIKKTLSAVSGGRGSAVNLDAAPMIAGTYMNFTPSPRMPACFP